MENRQGKEVTLKMELFAEKGSGQFVDPDRSFFGMEVVLENGVVFRASNIPNQGPYGFSNDLSQFLVLNMIRKAGGKKDRNAIAVGGHLMPAGLTRLMMNVHWTPKPREGKKSCLDPANWRVYTPEELDAVFAAETSASEKTNK